MRIASSTAGGNSWVNSGDTHCHTRPGKLYYLHTSMTRCFTGEDNTAAQRTYQAIGFGAIGDYGLLLF